MEISLTFPESKKTSFPNLNTDLIVDNVSISYPRNTEDDLLVAENISFKITKGQRVALVGPSGCGKTSILKCLTGLIQPIKGIVRYGEMSPIEAKKIHGFGLVPQRDALLEWRTTAKNISLPLELMNETQESIRERVKNLLDLVGLSEFENYFPRQLSGGMRSRVAIARALASNPKILLLDECFGNLDELTRERLNVELLPIWQQMKTSLVFITHSIREAVYLADKIVILTERPAKVKAVISVKTAKPRNSSFMYSEELYSLSRQVRAELDKTIN